jgi:hypothetical protein
MGLVSDKTIVCYSGVQYLLSRPIPLHPNFLRPGWAATRRTGIVIKPETGGGVFHTLWAPLPHLHFSTPTIHPFSGHVPSIPL